MAMALNWFRSCVANRRTSKTAKIIHFDGGVEEIKMRKKVAELMIDNPNQFVCDLGTLKAGSRILALAAEEEIEGGKTYLLLPFNKLRSLASETEMGKFHELKKIKCKQISSRSKIVPISHDGAETEKSSSLPKLMEEIDESVKMKLCCGQRSCWKPSLHTIEETRSFKFTDNYAAKRQVLTHTLR